jgi:hypothetical protein
MTSIVDFVFEVSCQREISVVNQKFTLWFVKLPTAKATKAAAKPPPHVQVGHFRPC